MIGSIRGIPVPIVFFSKEFGFNDRTVVVHDAIDYVVVDRRLAHSLPVDGYYYDREEPLAHEREQPDRQRCPTASSTRFPASTGSTTTVRS